uniref:Dehydrogenase/reductase (SDR family) X-linked n=1 Tax=Neogobius melanostomus TaxID=47308 RepID=A0A8C6UTW9_9GOBI
VIIVVCYRLVCHTRFSVLVEFVYLDLTSFKSIRAFVHDFKQRRLPLHVLINNAGAMLVPERRTEDGFEFHFGLNYLSHFLLTNLLLDVMKASGKRGREARVVNTASATHYAGVVLQSHGAYSQSKLALVLFTYHLQEQLSSGGFHVTVNAVDRGWWTPRPSPRYSSGGRLHGRLGCGSSKLSYDAELQEQLWKKSCKLVDKITNQTLLLSYLCIISQVL